MVMTLKNLWSKRVVLFILLLFNLLICWVLVSINILANKDFGHSLFFCRCQSERRRYLLFWRISFDSKLSVLADKTELVNGKSYIMIIQGKILTADQKVNYNSSFIAWKERFRSIRSADLY